MKPSRIITYALTAMRDRKLRAFLTILGITIGPAIIVAVVAVTQGFFEGLTSQFSKLGASTILVIPTSARVRLTLDDVAAAEKLPNVEMVAPFYRAAGTLKHESSSTQTQIVAIDFSKLAVLFPGLTIEQGSLPSEFDLTGAVVGYNFVNPSDPDKQPITFNEVVSFSTSVIRLRQATTVTRSFLVEATLGKFGQGITLDIDNAVFIPLRAGQILSQGASFGGMYVLANSVDTATDVAQAVSDILGDKARAISVKQIISTIQSVMAGAQVFLVSIAFMSVAVAFIGIMTTMFTSVGERTREIGLIKALGFSNRQVMLVFLSEAGLTGLLGGVLGSLSGVVLSKFIVQIFSGFGTTGPVGMSGRGAAAAQSSITLNPAITPELILGAILMAVVVGVLAGLIPAWRASRLTPIEALRHE